MVEDANNPQIATADFKTSAGTWYVELHQNLAGGDIGGGSLRGMQQVLRPVPMPRPYNTSQPGPYICSSSTPLAAVCTGWPDGMPQARSSRTGTAPGGEPGNADGPYRGPFWTWTTGLRPQTRSRGIVRCQFCEWTRRLPCWSSSS